MTRRRVVIPPKPPGAKGKVICRIERNGRVIEARKEPMPAPYRQTADGWGRNPMRPVYVDGVLRGGVGFGKYNDGRSWGYMQWIAFSLTPVAGTEALWFPATIHHAYKIEEALRAFGLESTDDPKATWFLPTWEQAPWHAIMRAADRREWAEAEERRKAQSAASAVVRQREAIEAHDEMMAGLESIAERDDLTNLQRVAIQKALQRLAQLAPARS